MACKFSVGDRVSSSFGLRGEITRYGTVVRLERGMPVVQFDGWRQQTMSRINCFQITRELVARLAAREPSSLNEYQRDTLANNQMLLEG